MSFSQESIVAVAAIAGSAFTTWQALRGQRRTQHDERLWQKRTEAYEQFLNAHVTDMKLRHTQMTEPVEPIDLDPGLSDEMIRVLNLMMIYASDPVRDALQDAEAADQLWREGCLKWQTAENEDVTLRAAVEVAWEHADLMYDRVAETIRREMISGKPRLLRLRRRAGREIGRGWQATLDASADPGSGREARPE